MALRDPIAAYNAANNVEAHLVRNALIHSGVEAFVTEDVSQVGTWMLGLIPEIHKPQVWIERADIERAKPILEEYERRAAELRDAGIQDEAPAEPEVQVVCEKCGQCSAFPAVQRGSVQQCQHCGAYVDVGSEIGSEEWPGSEGEADAAEES
jgi:hypothetical protein